jgi:amino acid adenylation domain-containing protein/non-ribosomal peptide synthase protein (TIGR01720 family)
VGVIEAGGAYVPLDPGYPAERLRYMIEDSGVEVILTDHAGAKRLPATAARLLLIEESSPHPAFGHPLPQAGEGADCSDRAFSRLREKVPEGRMRAESLAYVIYTSGSTGRPKGVMVEHRPIVRLTKNNPFVQLGPDAVMLQYAPATFDAATFEIWDPLLNGARLVLAPPGTLSLEELGAVIRSSGVNTLALTTGLFHAMVDERLEDLHGLREFLAGGDALSGEHVKRLLGTIPTVVAINGYGPTEATTLAACYRIESAGQVAHDVPIGRAIANTTMYVLDERLQPVPVNLTGELYIGGDALARGYAGGPALTAERFVPNPFRPGERLYRTGDVGRWNSRGELEFLGRFDEQLKVRGFRVEPGEIEAALREHEAVGNAAVIGRKEGIAATTILVAFVTPRPEADSPEPTLLRDFLRGRLPEHIVPAQIAVLDQLPLTPNGKVDRKALRTLGVASPQPAGEKAAPQTNDEETLLRIWSEVLKVDRIGVHDNFFELGGDSILGLLVVSRARDAGLILVPAALFEHPTIAGLAAFAVTRGATAPGEKQSDVGPLPVSPIVQWFFESIDCDVHHWNLAFPLRCRKQLDPGVVEKALHAVVKHHGGLRLRAERDQSGRWRLWVSSPEEQQPLRLHRIDLRAVPPESREMVRMSELNIVHASLDLLAGPVVRAVWIERDDELPELVLIGHHLAVDAVSWRTIGEDLELACAAIERGHEPALPAPGTSLRAWSSLLNETSTFDDQLEMWVEVCRRPAARLPRDREGEEREEFRRTLRRDVPPDRTDQLLRDAVKAYRMRVDEIILAAFASVMVRWTGEGAIRVDVEGYGREASRFPGVDLSRTVGWLTTIAPLYLELSTDHIGEILKHVKEQARAVPDRGLGFGILRYLREEGRRELSRYPRSEVSFNYLGSVDTLRDVSERFMLGRLDVGLMRSPRGRMPYLLSLDAVIVEGALQLHLTGNTAIHELETLESLADSILAELHRLVDHCLALETGEFTPSDFPEAELDAAQLQKLLAQLGAGEGDPA